MPTMEAVGLFYFEKFFYILVGFRCAKRCAKFAQGRLPRLDTRKLSLRGVTYYGKLCLLKLQQQQQQSWIPEEFQVFLFEEND